VQLNLLTTYSSAQLLFKVTVPYLNGLHSAIDNEWH
jgi:hypothetical protein